MPSSDPLERISSAQGELRVRPVDATFKADFADLAARFAADTGGGLSPELSADLALEIVLNEIVEQACLATGATGAAIVLERDGEMVCRATNGDMALQLGARLDRAAGLSGECFKTRQTQKCGDVQADPRAHIEASQLLGVRSVMVMPLLLADALVGVFELFSSRPYAFGERDERTLEALARRTNSNLERASKGPEPQEPIREDAPPVAYRLESSVLESVAEAPRRRSWFLTSGVLTWVLGTAVLVCAMILGVLVGRDLMSQKLFQKPKGPIRLTASSPVAESAPVVGPAGQSGTSPSGKEEHASIPAPQRGGKSTVNTAVPLGSLRILENGKEVFRLPPAADPSSADASSVGQGSGIERASSVEQEQMVELSPADARDSLLHRVEPEYPEEAREQQIQGPVVLDVRIAPNGTVEDVQVISGAPQLAQASTDAVKQWRFKPRSVNARQVEMQTRITLNFRLPQ
jgi:TonB family protein